MIEQQQTIVLACGVTIHLREVEFRFSRSGGPGGQHVNKTSSKVILLFPLQQSQSFSDEQKEKLAERLAHRLDKTGCLHLVVQESRSQHRNRALACERLQQVLDEALVEQKPRKKTKPSRAAQRRRLNAKRQRSERKRERSQRWD